MTKKPLLKKYIRRKLLFRLGLTILGVTLLFAGISYFHSRDMIVNAVIQASTSRVHIIQARFKELMRKPDADMMTVLQDAVNYPPDTNIHISEGEFIYAVLYSRNRDRIGIYQHINHPALAGIKKYLRRNPDFSRPGQSEYKSFTINSKQYIDILSKFSMGKNNPDLFFRGIFSLSEQAIHAVHQRAIRTVLFVIGVVLATAFLIYPVITHLLNRLADYSTFLLDAHLETMEALGAAIAKRDNDTDRHNYRVTIYAVSLGELLTMDEYQMQCLIKGAFLHDVGKIGIRDNILLNKEKFSTQEHEIMQKHVKYGIDIIKQSSWLKDAKDVVGSHHEKYDGSGYPARLKAGKIPLNARIFAIADVFDALTSQRPYKEPFSYEKTMTIMAQDSSHHFDPLLLEKFTSISKKLYDDYSSCDRSGLKAKLLEITNKYFHSGIDTLQY